MKPSQYGGVESTTAPPNERARETTDPGQAAQARPAAVPRTTPDAMPPTTIARSAGHVYSTTSHTLPP